jgi:hypothetical protein
VQPTVISAPEFMPPTQFLPTQERQTPLPSSVVEATPTALLTATSEAPICAEGWCANAGWFHLARPINPPYTDSIDPTYRFGAIREGEKDRHTGVEFKNSAGTPVLAVADGEVIIAGESSDGAPFAPYPGMYGQVVVLRHTSPEGTPYIYTLYAHLSRIDVLVGENLKAGDVLGAVGMTGYATGSHLHFEVRQMDNTYLRAINPELFLMPHRNAEGQSNGGLAGQINDTPGYIKTMDISVQRLADASQPAGSILYPAWYPASFLSTQENFALGDLPPGQYRIAVTAYAQVFVKIVPVYPGRLTTFAIDLKLLPSTP